MRRRTFGAMALSAAAGTALSATPAAAAAGDAHFLGRTTTAGLFHAIRFADGSWSRAGDVRAVTGFRAVVADAAGVLTGGRLNVVVAAGGSPWSAARRSDGSWTRFREVVTGTPVSGVRRVAVANVAGALHLAAVTSGGGLLHSIQAPDGSWSPFVDVVSTVPGGGPAADVAITGFGSGQLQLMTASTSGRLFHTVRRPTGVWDRLRDVELQIGEVGTVRRVTTSGVAGTLNAAVVADGLLWATVRRPDGSWGRAARFSPFELGGAVTDAGIATTSDRAVQLSLTTADTEVLHTVSRTGDHRAWDPVGDVRAIATGLPACSDVAMAGQ